MKISRGILALAFSMFTTLGVSLANAAQPFGDFQGTYKGNVVLGIGSNQFSGPATLRVQPTEEGRFARVMITASVTVNEIQYSIPNTLKFLPFGTFVTADITNSLETSNYSAAGTFTGKKVVNFTAPFQVYGGNGPATTGTYAGSLRFRNVSKRKQALTLRAVVQTDQSGVVYTLTFQASQRAKRSR